MDGDIQEWLSTLPLNTVVDLDGNKVYLNVYANGAELGAHLADGASHEQTQAALRHGFASAIEFGAGLAYAADGTGLALTRWLPGVHSWTVARAALEDLLSQLVAWRAWLAPPRPAAARPFPNRHEMQMRSFLLAKKS